MKKKILTGIALLSMALVVALNVNAYEVIQDAGNQDGGGGGYSCTVTSNCGTGHNGGSVSCTGVKKCERGWQWVKCDGNKTKC